MMVDGDIAHNGKHCVNIQPPLLAYFWAGLTRTPLRIHTLQCDKSCFLDCRPKRLSAGSAFQAAIHHRSPEMQASRLLCGVYQDFLHC